MSTGQAADHRHVGSVITPRFKGVQETKKQFAILAALGTGTLAACGSKTGANENNFGAALTQYIDKKGDFCLNTTRWPVDLNEYDVRLQKTTATGPGGQMAALEAAGPVKGENIEVDVMGIMGKLAGEDLKTRSCGAWGRRCNGQAVYHRAPDCLEPDV